MATASISVDLPTPFSPTSTVSSDSASPSRRTCATAPIENGHPPSLSTGAPTTSRTGRELITVMPAA